MTQQGEARIKEDQEHDRLAPGQHDGEHNRYWRGLGQNEMGRRTGPEHDWT